MVFTQGLRHTLDVRQRAMALVQFSQFSHRSLRSGRCRQTLPLYARDTQLDYVLSIRAFFNTTSKQKAGRFVSATFPGLPVAVVGPYWKDESLMEASAGIDVAYPDDKTAMWETMRYFMNITDQWRFRGPYGHSSDTVLGGIVSVPCGKHMTWCSFDLLRSEHLT